MSQWKHVKIILEMANSQSTHILDSTVTEEESGISNKMHRLASKLWVVVNGISLTKKLVPNHNTQIIFLLKQNHSQRICSKRKNHMCSFLFKSKRQTVAKNFMVRSDFHEDMN